MKVLTILDLTYKLSSLLYKQTGGLQLTLSGRWWLFMLGKIWFEATQTAKVQNCNKREMAIHPYSLALLSLHSMGDLVSISSGQ